MIYSDEFHHASAPTYQKFLNHFKPKILLGLKVTLERMDCASILDYFDNRFAAEIRLPQTIDRKLRSHLITGTPGKSSIYLKEVSFDQYGLQTTLLILKHIGYSV